MCSQAQYKERFGWGEFPRKRREAQTNVATVLPCASAHPALPASRVAMRLCAAVRVTRALSCSKQQGALSNVLLGGRGSHR